MIRALTRVGFAALTFAVLIAGPLPAPTVGLHEGNPAPALKNLEQCKKALSDLDAEYVTRHLTLVREIKTRRERILAHCMALNTK